MEEILEQTIELTNDQLNFILEMFNDNYGESIINQDDIDKAQIELDDEQEEYKKYRQAELDALIALKGFDISGFTLDDHVHDGQMCTYHFDFSSPSGALTEISTNMCLSVGFNHHESVTIKLVKSQKEINEKLEEAQRKDHEKQQEKKAKRGKSNSKWFLLISDQLIDKSPEEMYDILKEYKFPKQYKNLKKS